MNPSRAKTDPLPIVYLDNAATSWPKPDCVVEAMMKCIRDYGANPGRSGHRMAMRAADIVYECRENLSRLLGVKNPLCISFASNATEAINLAVKGVLRPGDHVVASPLEHNSVIRPLKHLERQGITSTIAEGDIHGRVDANAITAALRPNTRLIVVTHASNVTGAINPIDEIGRLAREREVLFLVDAAQTAGHVPIDVERMHIDLLAFPGHKGLLGPQGTGGLYIREDIRLVPLKEGGTGSESENPYQPDFIPDRYESGTPNTPGIAGLGAAVAYLLSEGIERIRKREESLTRHMIEGLGGIDGTTLYGPPAGEPRAGIVAFNVEGWDCNVACDALDRHFGIAARGGLHCAWLAHRTLGTPERGAIRLSPGIQTTPEAIRTAIQAVDRLANNPSIFR
jgi:cysteine desulfurase/selenocysteine lyase